MRARSTKPPGELPNKDRPNQVCSGTSQTSLMPPIDRSRRDLSIGGIRLVWEVDLHTWKSYLLPQAVSGPLSTIFVILDSGKMVGLPDLSSDQNRPNQVCSSTSQTSLMPPIDRSRRDLSIGGIRLVWEVQEHTWLGRSIFNFKKCESEKCHFWGSELSGFSAIPEVSRHHVLKASASSTKCT